ncbi:Ig-like domain-containing protein [Microbacterium lacus]|uniref:Ig-like domain-containing protein n=1 Tax=Microbacterium lacus TaxID=415217 RepID=UPI0018E224C3|nr:Ig-like domain-containing protein [Microbacterium lacus]
MPRRRRLISGLATVAALATVIGIGIVWPGLDARETPSVDTSVWALQTGDGRRYARVNTAIGELDTVRTVTDPTLVAQGGSSGPYLFSESFGKVTRVDEALPVDLDDEALRDSPSTPEGTTDVSVAGDFVAYLTDTGAVWVGRLSDSAPTQVDPDDSSGDDSEEGPQYAADAIAVDDAGILYSYSEQGGAVLRYDIGTRTIRGVDDAVIDATDPAISAASGVWFVVDLDTGLAWRKDAAEPIETDTLSGRVISRPSTSADAVYLADETRLVRLDVSGAPAIRELGTGQEVLGTPARPVTVDGTTYAAWLAPSGGGVLWNSSAGESVLDYAGLELDDQRRPSFLLGEGVVALNETRSGWVWTLPDGQLVATSQDWSLDDRVDPTIEDAQEEAPVVLDPKPPVAEPDAFGVRSGALVVLPVLLNDHDPNEDVLSIDPASVSGLDPGFGEITIIDSGQRLAVRVADGARGSGSFTYRVSDGTAVDGLYSEPTTVALTVEPEAANAAPEWCGSVGCLAEWPTPEVATGGTVSVPVLTGWVDPDGDPLLLLSVENPSGVGVVTASPSGEVVYQHADDGSGAAQLIELQVTVADTRGAVATKPLTVRVSTGPRLQVQSFAVVDTVGAGLTVDVSPHVTGTAGELTLTAVRVLDDAPASVVATPGGTAFDITAEQPGTYRVSFSVGDGTSEVTGTARITLLADDAAAQLATAPVVAFVHPREDATVDVFAAVSNPTRRVLLLSDAVPRIDAGASLSVDVVGQNSMRVSGTTATGDPGRLGTVSYVVSDGTSDAGARVVGEATVYLLPPAPELAPIAVGDSVVVRQGAQVDIPVLTNDVAPSGSGLTLNPAAVVSSTSEGLAFASGGVLRYLAPETPGEYVVQYGVYATGAPALTDTAEVRITVQSDDANRDPLPETLEGRVLSGQTTTIPFDSFGVDPDGDAVALDAVLSQPDSGAASISADGASIVYSSVAGFRGQVSFRYRVVDASGATGSGTVRVGVLDGQSNPGPVTFTDYVQVQVGTENVIDVSPLANDIDPTGGTLRVTGVQPDLPPTLEDGSASDEYERLESLVRTVDEATIAVTASSEPGTMSFLYDVESDSGNTARGLVVVRVVREAVPDYPVVADTVLTAETRDGFVQGVDVVSGKVRWTGGEISGLTLSLWGAPADLEVDGTTISGPLPLTGRIIAFELTGEGASGPVTTYGFLRIPGERDVKLALRGGASAQEVTEGRSKNIDMAGLVPVPDGTRLQVSPDVSASGARPQGSCELVSGTTVRYEAGLAAPWADACYVPVRLAGTQEWSVVAVPIRVLAVAPQPQLRSGALTIAPGASADFDLRTLTSWQGRDEWDRIAYAIEYTGSSFVIDAEDGRLTITGTDRAVPGTQEAITVSITSHTGVEPVRLLLRVGAVPSSLPVGGTLAQQCSQAGGSSCVIPVVGAAGEVNPLPGTPLEVIGVAATGACVGVTFSVASAGSVLAEWTEDAPGATCTASFTLRDAQGRTTGGGRDGALLLDLQGYPQAPTSVRQVAYADGAVTLRIDPGAANQAYPALSEFVVRSSASGAGTGSASGTVVATCSVEGICPSISAPNGAERTYEVVSVNAIGESRTSVSTVAWAYDTPAAPRSVTWAPVVTGGEGGLISLAIEGIDQAKTGSVQITSAAGETVVVDLPSGRDTLTVPSFRVGANTSTTVVVTPQSRFPLPPGLTGTASGASVAIQANGIGAPTGISLSLSSTANGNGTSTINAQATAASGGDGSTLRLGVSRADETCSPTSADGSAVFTVPDGLEYAFTACAVSRFAGETFGSASVQQSVRAVQSTAPPEGYTFVVSPTPDVETNGARWVIRDLPTSSEDAPTLNVPQFEGAPPNPVFDVDPGIRVRYTHTQWGTSSEWAPVTPASGSAPFQVQASWQVASCAGGEPLQLAGSSTEGRADIEFDSSSAVFEDAAGNALVFDPAVGIVPFGAVSVRDIGVTASWDSQGWGLAAASAAFGGACTTNNPVPEPPVEQPPVEPAP